MTQSEDIRARQAGAEIAMFVAMSPTRYLAPFLALLAIIELCVAFLNVDATLRISTPWALLAPLGVAVGWSTFRLLRRLPAAPRAFYMLHLMLIAGGCSLPWTLPTLLTTGDGAGALMGTVLFGAGFLIANLLLVGALDREEELRRLAWILGGSALIFPGVLPIVIALAVGGLSLLVREREGSRDPVSASSASASLGYLIVNGGMALLFLPIMWVLFFPFLAGEAEDMSYAAFFVAPDSLINPLSIDFPWAAMVARFIGLAAGLVVAVLATFAWPKMTLGKLHRCLAMACLALAVATSGVTLLETRTIVMALVAMIVGLGGVTALLADVERKPRWRNAILAAAIGATLGAQVIAPVWAPTPMGLIPWTVEAILLAGPWCAAYWFAGRQV